MQAELNSDVALSAANALLSHLRKNPGASLASARDLAAEFGLDESFVSQVLQGIHSNRRVEVRQTETKRGSRLRATAIVCRDLWLKATSRPIRFVVFTFLLCFVAEFAAVWLIPTLFPKPKPTQVPDVIPATVATAIAVLSIAGLTGFMHFAVYFQHRRSRNAVYGALVLFGCMLAAWVIPFLNGVKETGSAVPNLFVLYLIGAVALLMLSLMYAGMGSLASILGAWSRIRSAERAEDSMSRQDLLERYFELQSRLQKSAYPRPAALEPRIFRLPFVAWYRRHQFYFNFSAGVFMSSLRLLGLAATGFGPGHLNVQANASPWVFLIVLVGLANYVFYILQGYLSTGGWRATLGAVVTWIGSQIVVFSPIGTATRTTVNLPDLMVGSLIQLLFYVGISCSAYLGAVVQLRSVREANLEQNDQATLLAEMVRIQWKLSDEVSAVCVLVVDAAQSSVMKASEDPLAVEYIFREYQEWIAAICTPRGGKVHSTAGDGAVVAFATCPMALSAARKIQTDIFQFNKDVNRLTHPFRLRVGLHTGEIIGDINEVQFTEVIDIAAHIEGACPIGGVAVTDDVVQRIPEEQFIDLGKQIDGHQVFMLANPTEYS